MLDDVRHHDATPTAEERAWIDSNPVAGGVRVAVLLVLAIAIGGYVSLYLDLAPQASTVAAAGR